MNNSIQHLNKDSISFIRYRTLFEILIKLEKSKRAANEMIYVCKQFYEKDKIGLTQIADFEKDVENAFASIYWYTKPSFIVHLLNRACGSQDIDQIYPFRLFISNLHYELVQLFTNCRETIPKDEPITVYRGKYLALSTFEKLKNNKNGLVAMSGFFSTTRDEKVAKGFASEGILIPGKRVVLYKLVIDPKIIDKPYADIPPERHAIKGHEKELLFSIGSVWRIINVDQLKDDTNPAAKMWCVELALSNEDDEQSIELAAYLKMEFGEKSSIWTLGDFLTRIGQYQQAENYYRLLEYSLPETETDRATIYNRIAYVKYEKEEYLEALDKLKKAMEYASDNNQVATVAEFIQQVIAAESSPPVVCASALCRRFENDGTRTKYLISSSASIPIIKNNIGLIFHQIGHPDFQLECYKDALKILLNSELSFLSEISAVYNNIGSVHFSKKKYPDAVENFRLAITTLSTSDPSDRCRPWIQEYTENYQKAQRYVNSHKTKRLKTE